MIIPRLVARWQKITFDSDPQRLPVIYVMNADGSGPTNLTNSPASDDIPRLVAQWQQDRLRLLRDGGDATIEIYVMNVDGSGQHA